MKTKLSFRHIAGLATLITLSVFSASCAKQKIGAASTTRLTSTNQVNEKFVFQLFQLGSTSQDSSYIGTLQYTNAKGIEYPASMKSHLNAVAAGSTPIKYYVRAYSATTKFYGTNGDFYFEAPVVGSTAAFNGPSTALWYAVRNAAYKASGAMNLTSTTWSNALFLLDSNCPSCMLKLASGSLAFMQTNTKLLDQINTLLTSASMTKLTAAGIGSLPVGVAYSYPPLLNGSTTLPQKQGQTQVFQLVLFDPQDTSTPVFPEAWNMYLANSAIQPIAPIPTPDVASFEFDATNLGLETMKVTRTLRGIANYFYFNFNVAFSNLNPNISVPDLQFQANHNQVIDLTPYASDPRGQALTFMLVSGPTGMTLNGSNLQWNPTQDPVSQVGSASAQIAVFNTDGGVGSSTANINVLADNYPKFATDPPTPWDLTEAVTGTLTFTISDSDGDPIEVTCVAGCSTMATETYTTAGQTGWPVNELKYTSASTFYTPVAPASFNNITVPWYTPSSLLTETVNIGYKPSYLQTIASNFSGTITLSVNYPIGDAALRQGLTPEQKMVTINVTNVADPPVWAFQPQLAPIPVPLENTNMATMNGGAATIPPINPPTDDKVTYSIANIVATPGTAANCSWITLTPTGQQTPGTFGALNGFVPYDSAASCKFNVRATDLLGLYTDSAQVNVTETIVPRTITTQGTIPMQTITEGTQWTLNLYQYFYSVNASDPKEVISFSCLNCAAKGIQVLPVGGPNSFNITGATATGAANWNPFWGTAPTGGSTVYTGVQIQADNNRGSTAVQTFDITVLPGPAPMKIDFSSNSLVVGGVAPNYTTSLNANSSGSVWVNITNYPGVTNTYPYALSFTCSPNCSATPANLPVQSGSGVANFVLNITPSYSDGYGGPFAPNAIRTISVKVADVANPTSFNTGTLITTVNTMERPYTILAMNGDENVTTYNITIDGSMYDSNSIYLIAEGPDQTNASFVNSFASPVFGSIAGPTWNFNPVTAGCMPGAGSTVKNFTLRSTSSHGQFINRAVQATIINATIGGGGGCPY